MRSNRAQGFTVWFTGVSGVGKSSLGRALAQALCGPSTQFIDGDDFRKQITPELGFSNEDRSVNVRCIGYVSGLLAQHGVAVIVAAIAPHRIVRETVRSSHLTPFIEVFLECELSERIRRDPKGIYAEALRGEIDGLTGLSAPYEPPLCPDVHIHTDQSDIREGVDRVLDVLARRQLIEIT